MSPQEKTIAALLTPRAPGAIAVIGLMGGLADEILAKVVWKRGGKAEISTNRPTFCQIADQGQVIDDAVVVRITSTNRTWIELNVHGGVWIANRVLSLLEKHGASVVEPLEFLEGTLPVSLIERDVRAALLKAGSRRMAHWLMHQAKVLPQFIAQLDSVSAAERDTFLARSRVAIALMRGLSIAIVGPPNAGKSTLVNQLIGSDRIITSDIPGTTRDWISETALIDGWPVTLTDTAGIRKTDCPIEKEAILRGRAEARRADLILIVADATLPQEVRAKQVTGVLSAIDSKSPVIVVQNKYDLCPSNSPMVNTAGILTIHLSALRGEGIDELKSTIAATLGLDHLRNDFPTAFRAEQLTDLA